MLLGLCMRVDHRVPLGIERGSPAAPGLRRRIAVQPRLEIGQRFIGIADDRQRQMLAASKRAALTAMSFISGAWKTVQEPVVKSCSRVPMASTTSASAASALAEEEPITPSGPAFMRMLMAQHPAPGDGLGHGDAVLVGEGGEALARLGIMHAAAGEDQRPLGLAQQSEGRGDLRRSGRWRRISCCCGSKKRSG